MTMGNEDINNLIIKERLYKSYNSSKLGYAEYSNMFDK